MSGPTDREQITQGQRQFSDDELQDLVASTDSGARDPSSKGVAMLIAGLALAWSLFQLWIAQPQLWFAEYLPVLNSSQTRPIHLTFAIVLAFLAYPAFKGSPRDRVPVTDWILLIVGGGCAFYVFWFSDHLALTARSGLPTDTQVYIGAVGLLCLLEASRRALGPALTVVGSLFLLYAYMGTGWLIPELVEHEGLSFTALMNAQWLDTAGVFGIPLGVSTAFVFLFVLFGSLLDKAGAGNYFIKLAFAGLGHLRGGPAKAAVVGSAMTGLISGSSIANVVTTGTFTIPLMKRVGFTSEQAGSVEVASSVNGQIMPPVMGAAAFLMVEFIGISYVEVIKHAFIPAVISYIALVYIVHLEALKKDMPALGEAKSFIGLILNFFIGFAIAGAAFTALIYAMGALESALPALSGPIAIVGLLAVYIYLVSVAAKRPDLEVDDPNATEIKLPTVKEVYATGLHYVLPIVVLVWFLMVERQSPAKSAFYATSLMLFIIVTQRPLKALFRGQGGQLAAEFKGGFDDLIAGLIGGARNMIGIGVATAAAGIIVATVTKTPIGTELAGLVEMLSGGNLLLMLMLIGLFSLILGMGLPTTANYIVVSSLMASVVVSLGAQEGLIVPLIAAHLFVFYFGIMADVTPPVGLASFAAAAVSGGDPIKTGFTAFFYSLRTVALPFLFIFNPTLILYGVDLGTWAGIFEAITVFIVATIAMLLFAAATQGYFFARSRIYESAMLLLVAFTLFVPNVWLDMVQSPFRDAPPAEFESALAEAEADSQLRLLISGPDFDTGEIVELTLPVTVSDAPAAQRVSDTGILMFEEGDIMRLDEPMFGSDAGDAMADFDFYSDEPVQLVSVQVPQNRMPKEVFYLPALLLLGLVIALQRRRQTKPAF
ncbi:TRAP transporter permease [Pontivivens insulae]|uniref:C4-dicarboxylate TRAP transporter large permease protein DctM n=1 Tax=Pontivivens insulae TaxID=1639689 RepID=A0A2R8AFE8_9RHOB|nr:TRAP transporter permease [Pontivivens insulae]RED12206.1 TRAP transporter 4TM/12TM fusion protein [Pontivivens insulae]SPF30962.1 C4-dicarboxylate TRAP transporter large permease protein DctM [Pontivivens insulae]